MSLIERTLNGEDPLDENGTAESSVPDFFMANWYSQCGTCGDSPVVMRPPALERIQASPSLDEEPGAVLDLRGRIQALNPSFGYSTTTVPVILLMAWMRQWYGYLPGRRKTQLNLSS
jgi:hypothetical protein